MKIQKTTIRQMASLIIVFALLELLFALVFNRITYIRALLQGVLGLGVFAIPYVRAKSAVHYLLAGCVLTGSAIVSVFLLADNVFAQYSIWSIASQAASVLILYFWLRKYWSSS